jgi:hypothetical protein
VQLASKQVVAAKSSGRMKVRVNMYL